MPNQSRNGKAFEFACVDGLVIGLTSLGHQATVVESQAMATARDALGSVDSTLRIQMQSAGVAAAKLLLQLENNLGMPSDDEIRISIQSDTAGQSGDVRDILVLKSPSGWETGVSAKWNHRAVKSNRLSMSIDFGREWMGIPCSDYYFDEIRPVFQQIEKYAESNRLWRQVPSKSDTVYMPILEAFRRELERLRSQSGEIPQKLLEYMVGRYDFYKVIGWERKRITEIEAFNLHGKLGKRSTGGASVRKVRFPSNISRIIMKPKSKTTLLVEFDNGWQLSLRLHSARSKVENSLKFDVMIVGYPNTLDRYQENWH